MLLTQNEIKLINLIREDYQPESALVIAIEIIFSYLEQRESSEEPSPAYLQELT